MCPFIVFRGPKRTEPSAGFDVMAELGTTSAAADSVTEGVKEATFGRNAGWGWRVGRRGVKEVNVLVLHMVRRVLRLGRAGAHT